MESTPEPAIGPGETVLTQNMKPQGCHGVFRYERARTRPYSDEMTDRAKGEMGTAAGAPIRTSWADVKHAAPSLAASVQARFAANRHHTIATLRPDGSPRISGTEVRFDDGHVQLGMMPRSLKLGDVLRDPRLEIHSAPLEPELEDGDARIHGRAVYLGGATAPDGTPMDGSMFAVDVEQVVLVRVEGEELVVTHWTPARGLHETRRR